MPVTVHKVQAGNHFIKSVLISRQEHRFEFEIDQSYLSAFIADCRRVLLEFPFKGDREDAAPAAQDGAQQTLHPRAASGPTFDPGATGGAG
jgi:hypothetical protein